MRLTKIIDSVLHPPLHSHFENRLSWPSGLPTLQAGEYFLTDEHYAYLTDENGNYLTGKDS